VAQLPLISERWAYSAVLGTIFVVAAALVYGLGPRVLTQAHEIARAIPTSVGNVRAELDRYSWGKDITRVLAHSFAAEEAAKHAGAYASTAADAVADVIVILAIGAFVGANPGLYRGGVVRLFADRHRSKVQQLLEDVASTLRGWLLGQLIPMAALGIGTFIGLWILGIPLALTLALFTATMLFIPYIGSVLAYIPTVLIALTYGPMKAIYVTALYVGVHIAEGYVITPLAQRHVLRLPPALTLFGQLLMWQVAGFLGVVLATPLTAVCLVTVQRLYLKREPNASATRVHAGRQVASA
jgi:predicted PurR-regulated permease PerM